MGFLTRLLAGLVSAATLGAGLSGTANVVGTTTATAGTTGAVTATADDTGGRTVLDCRQSGEGATGPYADNFCWIDWSNLPLSRTGEPIPVRINVPGGHIDADATITHTDNAALAAKDFTGSKWSRLTSAYKLTGNTALAFSGRMGRQDPAASVTFSNITPSADRTDTGVNVLKDFRLAFGDAEVMSGGVLQGHDVYEQTDIESDKTLEKLGMIGSGDPNQSYSKANTGYGTTHVTLAGGPKGATDDANKDSKGSAVVGAKQASRFKVSFGQVNQHWDGWGSAIAVGVYMPYLTAYPLTYDKNSSDAAGEVPSNQRGKENTTQPAKTKTNGKIRLASDTSKLSDHLVNSDFEYLPDGGWKTVDAPSYMTNAYTSVDPNNGQYMRNAQHSDAGLAWVDWPGFDRSKFAWRTDQKGGQDQGGLKDRANAVELQQDSTDGNTYAEMVASETGRTIYQDLATIPGTLYKIRLKHASLCKDNVDKMQVVINGTPIEMTRVTANGKAGDKVGEKSTTIATKVTNENRWHHADQWETYEGYYVIPDGQITTRFGFKAVNYLDPTKGNLLDDVTFARAYKLSYDKNSTDATGEVPSNQRGKENTTQPAKTKTNGTVKTVADDKNSDDATGSVPSDTTANTVKQAKAKSSGTVRLAADRTDGKVSDLVQRTTTHADGSVTVRTVDTTTDVVSGCQVYYPAGQKITLATMAKDDDCWDSSMLSRPGHTQLGWNQDRNATQAQAEVTMVEGGMAVYAVWVGNPVLTYDTNKPSTWSGQMPSTPASVSVAYNTAVTDGSGWRAGDTTKIRGYRFLGWYTGPQDNAGLYDWTRPLTGNVTVYAHWQRLQANVVYNANGGTGSHANTTGWQYSDVTIPGDTSKSFTRDGYVFKGWSLKAGKADVVYKDGSQIPLQDKDITLYAQWQGIHENFTETGGISLPLLIAGGIGLLVMGVGSTVMLTRRMNDHGMPDGE